MGGLREPAGTWDSLLNLNRIGSLLFARPLGRGGIFSGQKSLWRLLESMPNSGFQGSIRLVGRSLHYSQDLKRCRLQCFSKKGGGEPSYTIPTTNLIFCQLTLSLYGEDPSVT